MSCILCAEFKDTNLYNINETVTIHSMTPLKQLFQRIIDSSISVESICNEQLCETCYDDFNELDLMELKLKKIVNGLRKRYSDRSNIKERVIISQSDGEIYSVITVRGDDEFFDDNNTEVNSVSDSLESPKILNSNGDNKQDMRFKKKYRTITKKELKESAKIHFSDQQDLKNILNIKIKSEDEAENLEDKMVSESNVSVLYDMMDEKSIEIYLDPQSETDSKEVNNQRKLNKCNKCNMSFDSKQELKSHSALHVEEKSYICEVCGKVYRHKNALNVHVGMHKGIYPYKCLHCDKSFTQKGAMIRHNKIHTGEKPYQCDECGKCFTHHTSFTIHKISHSGEKSYKCNVCGLMLMSTSHLNRHMRVHTGEKRYSCTTCGKRFAERYNLVSHSKLHNVNGPVSNQKKKFRCDMCNVVFHKRLHLEDHITKAHSTSDSNYLYMFVHEDQDNQT